MKTKNSKFHFDNLFYFDPKKIGPFILYQIGDIRTGADYDGEEHVQFCHEISLIVSGKGSAFVNGKEYPLCRGNVLFTRYGAVHSMKTDPSDPMRFYYLGIRFDKDDPKYRDYAEIEKSLISADPPLKVMRSDLNGVFQMAFSEMVNSDVGRETVLESCISQILVFTCRTFTMAHEPKHAEHYLKNNQDPSHDVVNFVNSHFYDIRTLSDITDYIGYNYSYASRVFKNDMGVSIKEYYQRVRFEKASDLLKARFTVTEVAEKLGFSSIHSFSRAFKNRFGYPPTELTRE